MNIYPLSIIATASRGGGGGAAFYVDSIAGDDGNLGTSAASPFQTIAAVNAVLEDGMTVKLKRGSVWREQLGVDGEEALTDMTVQAYGDPEDPMPILDCADVVTPGSAWVIFPPRVNVYTTTYTHAVGSEHRPSVWEDGVRLRWVSGTAIADGIPGTYHSPDTEGDATTQIYVHASDSGDPDTNGKVYEVSTRHYGLYVAGGSLVENIHTKRNLHHNGSMVIGSNSTINGCLAEDGVVHNMWISEGSTANDCIVWKCDWPDRVGHTGFISFTQAGTGKSVTYNRCIAVYDPDMIETTIDEGLNGLIGFYAHTSGVDDWDSVNYNDCSAYSCDQGFAAADVLEYHSTRCFADNCYIPFFCNTGVSTITDFYAKEGTTVHIERGLNVTNAVIDGFRIYAIEASNAGDIYSGGDVTVTNSVMVRPSGSGFRFHINHDSAGDLTVNGVIIKEFNNNNMKILVGSGTFVSNGNVFYSGGEFSVDGSGYANFAAYRVGEPTQDTTTLTTDPLLVDPANGDFSLGVGSPAIALGAGLVRPDIDYTPIPDGATLADM